jgi:hypothetical protein
MEGELTTGQSVLGALLITLLLAALHVAAPRVRALPGVPEAAMGSFAGGLAVTYVFLHLLPELAEGNEAIGEALSDVLRPTPLLDLGVFLVALVGFTAFYGLERLADRRPPAPSGRARIAAEAQAGRRTSGRARPSSTTPGAGRATTQGRGCTGCTWGRFWSTTH